MGKWKIKLESIVEAENRAIAWRVSRDIFERQLGYIAQVQSIPQEPVPKPEEWIAINEVTEYNDVTDILKKINS